MREDLPELHAVIGVRHSGERTYYVKRSLKMENYPGLWSLLSIQFDPDELPDPQDTWRAQLLMERLSAERLGGIPIQAKKYLISGNSTDNPYDKNVILHLYEIELLEEPVLNPDYYTDAAWLTPEEYERRTSGERCGLCLRLWADYAWMAGITRRPFVPQR